MKGVTAVTNTAGGGCEIEEGMQPLILKVDAGDTPEWGVGI